MSKKTELQEIRETFGASREQFGKVFLGGLSANSIYLYEKGKIKIPNHVMMLARRWIEFYKSMSEGESND